MKNVISKGPLRGKKIEFASTEGIDKYLEISEEFMKAVFNFDPGEYLISDESSLYDFTGLDEMNLDDIQKRIREIFDIDISDTESIRLVEIFMKIHRNRNRNSL